MSGIGGVVQQVASSSLVKGLVVMLLLLASISHSMLIYQLSNISQVSSEYFNIFYTVLGDISRPHPARPPVCSPTNYELCVLI